MLLLVQSAGVSFAAAAQRPFIPPVQAEIIRGFEPPSHRFGPGHRGIDYGVPAGTPVQASGAGTVAFAGTVAAGLFVTLQHANGIETTYSFLSRIDVAQGDQVNQATFIGLSGEGHPGESPALHFGAKLNGEYIDPLSLLADFNDITDLLSLSPTADGGRPGDSAGPAFQPAADPLGNSAATGIDIRGPPGPGVAGIGSVPHLRVGAQGALSPVFAGVPVQGPAVQFPAPGSAGIHGDRPAAVNLPVRPTLDLGAQAGSPRAPAAEGRRQELLDVLAPSDASFSGSSNETLAAWWRTLTPEQKAALVGEDLQGWARKPWVSAHDRDAMNRILLKEKIKELEAYRNSPAGRAEVRRKNMETELRKRFLPWTVISKFDREAAIDRKIRSAKALSKQLTAVTKDRRNQLSTEDVYLLDFDIDFANGDGKGVVALGDPGTAEHVGVVVPGINNALGTIDGSLSQAAVLRASVNRISRKLVPRTATIAWLGYDNPNGLHDAANRAEAQQGAPWLKSFVNGLRTGHTNSPQAPHITVFGHSYGSVVAGIAALDGMKADDLVVYGSPGIGKSFATAKDFQQRVWAALTRFDPIVFARIVPLMGTDPMSPDFGAREVPLDSDQKGHAGYVRHQSKGALNFARIMTGQFEDIE